MEKTKQVAAKQALTRRTERIYVANARKTVQKLIKELTRVAKELNKSVSQLTVEDMKEAIWAANEASKPAHTRFGKT